MSYGDDELVLDALECYERAVRRVADDFARRGAVTRPKGVHLDSLDTIILLVDRPGPAGESSLGSLHPTRDLEAAVVELADLVQEKEFDEGDNTWPGCLPAHTHPPAAALVDGVACWTCPRSDAPVAAIG